MGIKFPSERWAKIRENSRQWWNGELKRPLVQVILTGCDPGRPEPKLPYYAFQSSYDFSVPVEVIVDRLDYELSCREYLGDAFPAFWPNFGAGIMVGFLGAEVIPRLDTTWFHPAQPVDIRDLRFEYDPNNPWLQRVKALMQATADRWQGQVQIGMTDLGGNLDILFSFRPNEQLLFDLYDHPDEVRRLTWEIHDLWWRYFTELDAIVHPTNPGYTAWAQIFSETPCYMLQCDFCYMIGPEMFDEFVKPELQASCRRLDHAFYHLDGRGQLPHLDSLLSIKELKGIQMGTGSRSQAAM